VYEAGGSGASPPPTVTPTPQGGGEGSSADRHLFRPLGGNSHPFSFVTQAAGTQFACFTGTKVVQILTQKAPLGVHDVSLDLLHNALPSSSGYAATRGQVCKLALLVQKYKCCLLTRTNVPIREPGPPTQCAAAAAAGMPPREARSL
jgi:hypothetical protein